ncbi:MAG: type II secretion system minor pseudopilin GspK [Chromatiales bacterium]|jgi:general secretion pathway protein K
MKKNHGVALVSVMIVIAIVAGIGAAVVVDQQYSMRRTANLLHGNQAFMHLLALESWGLEVLVDDKKQERAEDSLLEDWARVLPPVSADGGIVSGQIRDLQGRFNLNTVFSSQGVNPVAYRTLTCLLTRYTDPDADPEQIVSALVDWIDPDQDVHNNRGAEDLDYLSSDPSYRTASRPLISPSEMLLLKGMNHETYDALMAYVTALPMPTLQEQGEKADYMINVNTASEELLDCLGDGTDPVGSALVEEIRTSGPFTSREEVLAFIQAFLNIQENFDTSAWPLDVESNYFQISTRAEFGDLIMQMQHVVERGDNDIRVLMRSYGQQW